MAPTHYLAPTAVPRPWSPEGVPVLQAPVWGQQSALGETEAEYAAFTHWLPGDVTTGQVATRTGMRESDVLRLLRSRAWDVRAREYWQHTRVEGAAAIHIEQTESRESRALARDLIRESLALGLLEVRKATAEAKLPLGAPAPEGPPRLFNNRELAAWLRASAGLDVMRERAGLGAQQGEQDDTAALDWERVPADELEAYRRAREKALGR